NASGAALKAELDGMRLHGLSRLWMNFVFAAFLRKGAYSKAELDELLAASPLSSWNIAERGIGLYVYLQK
ncbi:MAG: hypothetical protein LBB22_04010, partial [Treponema sp.]|nr:hypothetical protein [Treponema sp.]